MKKKRKPRTLKRILEYSKYQGKEVLRIKQNYDLCPWCGCVNCDPMMDSNSIANLKIQKRLRTGLCMGCGRNKDDCKCKSSIN